MVVWSEMFALLSFPNNRFYFFSRVATSEAMSLPSYNSFLEAFALMEARRAGFESVAEQEAFVRHWYPNPGRRLNSLSSLSSLSFQSG